MVVHVSRTSSGIDVMVLLPEMNAVSKVDFGDMHGIPIQVKWTVPCI